MSRTFRKIKPKFLRKYSFQPYEKAWRDEDFLNRLRRGLHTQSYLKNDICGWPEDYCGQDTRRFCKRNVAKQRRNRDKREILNHIKGKAS